MDRQFLSLADTFNTDHTSVIDTGEHRLTFIRRVEILRGHSIPLSSNATNKGVTRAHSPPSLPRIPAKRLVPTPELSFTQPKQLWKIVANVSVANIREDYYSTTLTGCSSWVQDPCREESGLERHRSSEAERSAISALNELDEVNFVTIQGVHCWSKQLGFRSIISISPSHFSTDIIVCVAKSKLGLVVTGYNNGFVEVYDLLEKKRLCYATVEELLRGTAGGASQVASARGHSHPTHLLWISGVVPPNKTSNTGRTVQPVLSTRLNHHLHFVLGDSHGRVLRVGILKHKLVVQEVLKTTAYHHENICSMALDRSERQLAVTSTDSMVSVWTKGDNAPPSAQFSMCIFAQPHNSAVRGVSFCPGCPYLLATGGGRHDRTLRVFHLATNELTFQLTMPGQIVALIWLSKWELFVGLGHSRVGNYHGLGKVLSIATRKVVADIPGEGYTLSAVKTANGMCLNSSMARLITFSWQCDSISLIPSSRLLRCPLSLPMPQFR